VAAGDLTWSVATEGAHRDDEVDSDGKDQEENEGCHGSNSALVRIVPPVAGLTQWHKFLPY
jgi:hypothetical protein